MFRGKCIDYEILRLFAKFFAVAKVPCIRLEAARTGVSAAAYKKAYPNALAVCYVNSFYISVIHFLFRIECA